MMGTSAQDVALDLRSNRNTATVDHSPSTSCRNAYSSAEPPFSGSSDSLLPPPSRLKGYPFPVSRDGASCTQRYQHMSQQPSLEESVGAYKEPSRCALKPVWKYTGISDVSRVTSPSTPLDSGNVRNNGDRLHISRPPAIPLASPCFLPSNTAIPTETKMPPAEYTRPTFLRPEANVPADLLFPRGRTLFRPADVIPSCFYPENIVSAKAWGGATHEYVLTNRFTRDETGHSNESTDPAGTRKDVSGATDVRVRAVLPDKLQCPSGVAQGLVQASPIVNNVKSTSTPSRDHSVFISNLHAGGALKRSTSQQGPASSSVIESAHHAAEGPTTRRYAILLQQSHIKGQQKQVTASFALRGAAAPKTVPLPGCTAPSGSSGTSFPPTYSLCSSSTLLPPTYVLAPRNAAPPAAALEGRQHRQPALGASDDCSIPSIVSLHAKQHAEQADSEAVQQPFGFLQGQQQRCHYLHGTFHNPVVPASIKASQWCYFAPRCPQRWNIPLSSSAKPTDGDKVPLFPRVLPFTEACAGPIERHGESENTGEYQHLPEHQYLLHFYRRRRPQSAGGLQSATTATERQNISLAECDQPYEVRVRQRSRSHPPQVSLSHSSTEETTPNSKCAQNGGKEPGGCPELFRRGGETEGRYIQASAVGLEKQCKLRSRAHTFDTPSALELDTSPTAAFSPAVPSPPAHDVYRGNQAAIEQDQCGRMLPPGQVMRQRVSDSLRGGQLRKHSTASDHADASAAVHSTGFAFALPRPLTVKFSADAGVRAAASSTAAAGAPHAVLTDDGSQVLRKESHFRPVCKASVSSFVQQDKRASACEGALFPGDNAGTEDAASGRTATTTSPGLLQRTPEVSGQEAVDYPEPKGSLPFSQNNTQQESDPSTCSEGHQLSSHETGIHARTSFILEDRRLIQKPEEDKAEEVEPGRADTGVNTGFPTLREERKFSRRSKGASTNSAQVLQCGGPEKQDLKAPDAQEGRRMLPPNAGEGKSDHHVSMEVTSEQASARCGPRLPSQEEEKSDCGVAVRRTTSSFHENHSVRTQWGEDPWVDLHLSEACCYSRRGSRREQDVDVGVPQEDYNYGEGELEAVEELDATSKVTLLMRTSGDDDVHRNKVVGADPVLESRKKKSNTYKCDGEGRANSLPWKSVIVNTKNCRVEKALINTCAQRLGWGRNEVDAFKGHIVWLGGSAPDFEHLHYNKPIQIINRFPGMWDMTKKRMLYRILSLYGQLFPTEYDFFPPCWSLPEDRVLIEQMLHGKNKKFYILKPDGGTRGNGVQLVSLYKDIDPMVLRGDGSYIMQKYVEDPYLLNKKKFDFRIYCLLFSISGVPKAYVSKLGMVRFCTEEYQTPSRRNIDNPFMHLTNYSINKDNLYSFVRSTDLHDDTNSKRLLKDVFEELAQAGVDVDMVWQQIKSITAKTVVCLQPWLNLRYRHIYRGRPTEPSRCFQLLGLDILLDRNNKCWLLEVNSNPSLRIDYFDSKYDGIDVQLESAVDRHIKEPVVTEALALAYRVLLQHRHPQAQPTRRCGSRNRQSWYVRKPAAATAQEAGKTGCRSQLGRSSARITNCCTGSEGEEETETDEVVATSRDTRAARAGGAREGRAAAAGRNKAAAMLATDSTARRKVGGGRVAAARGKVVDGTVTARLTNSVSAEEGAAATAGAERTTGMSKGESAAETAVEEDGKHREGKASHEPGIGSSKQTAALKMMAGQHGRTREEKKTKFAHCREGETEASSRSAGSLQRQQFAALGACNLERQRSSNTRKKLEHPRVEGVTYAVHGRKGVFSETSSGIRLRASSAAGTDRSRRRGGPRGSCTPTVSRGSRTRSKNRKSALTYDAASKHAEEEDDEYSDARIYISPKRAVEEARKLLARLGPATVLERRASDESLLSSPGRPGPSDMACMRQSTTTCAPAAGVHPANACARSETAPAAGASSLHRVHTATMQPDRWMHDPASKVLCSDETEAENENYAAAPVRGCFPLSPAAGDLTGPAVPPAGPMESKEAVNCVSTWQSASDTSCSEEGKDSRETRRNSAAMAAEQETSSLLHTPTVHPSTPTSIQASRKGSSLVTGEICSPAAAAAASRLAQPKGGTQETERSCCPPSSDGEDPETVKTEAREKDINGESLSQRRRSSVNKGGLATYAADKHSKATDTLNCGTSENIEREGTEEATAVSPHCSTRRDGQCESGFDLRSSSTKATCTLASSRAVFSCCPPSLQPNIRASDHEVQQSLPATSSADATAAVAHGGTPPHKAEGGELQQQQRYDIEVAGCNDEDSTSAEAWAEGSSTSRAVGASEKENRNAGAARTDSGETRLATEAEQLAVKLEWIEEAYREMEKCMDRFNILGLRFASRTVSSSSASHQQHGISGSGDSRQQGEGAAAGVISARRGGGGASTVGAGTGKGAAGRDGKRTGPYKPFLRKDKLASRSANQTPPRSCYTKLHKDILHPLPPEYLKPQHCWVDLTTSIVPLMETTACVLQVQLLFERIVGFPRLICLQREKLLEACRLVKLPDVLRKVQVPIAFPPTTRSASSRFHTIMRPLSHSSPFHGSSAVRGGGRDAASCFAAAAAASNGGGPELGRTGNGAWLIAAAGGGRGGGPASAAGESLLSSSYSGVGLLGKRIHGRGSSSRTGSSGTITSKTQWSRSGGVAASMVAHQQLQQRQGGGCTSMARLQASRGFGTGNIERRRRLGLPDLEVLFYAQLQGVRRQLQLQEASFGLGLLETWYLLEPIALVCYPFFPTKAKLLEAFMNPLAVALHEKQRSSAQMRLLKSPAHVDWVTSWCKTKPKLEQMLQQLEEEDRLAFAAADGEATAAGKVRRSRGRSRCREGTLSARQGKGSSLEADKGETEADQSECAADDSERPSTAKGGVAVTEQPGSVSTRSAAAKTDRAAARSPHERPRCTGPINWGSNPARCDSAATLSKGCIATAAVEVRSERSRLQLPPNMEPAATRGSAGNTSGGSASRAGEGAVTAERRAAAGAGTVALAEGAQTAGETISYKEISMSSDQLSNVYVEPPVAARVAVQEQYLLANAGSGVNGSQQQQPTRIACNVSQQQQRLFASASSVQLNNCVLGPDSCSFKHTGSRSAAGSPAPTDACVFDGDGEARRPSQVGAKTSESCAAAGPHCGEFGVAAADGSILCEEAKQLPLLFLWGRHGQQQQSFVDDRDVSTVSTQPSAQAQCDNYRTPHAASYTAEVATIPEAAAASSCTGRSAAVTYREARAADDSRALPMDGKEGEDLEVLLQEAPLQGVGDTAGYRVRGVSTPKELEAGPSSCGRNSSNHSGSGGETSICRMGSAQEGRGEEDESRSPLREVSQARSSCGASTTSTAPGASTAAGLEIPEWHAGLCAAWPEDIWAYIRRSVPTEDRLAAMKRLVDYFHLRLDYCSFCALVPGAAGSGKV